MEFTSSRKRRIAAFAVSGLGALSGWYANEPAGFLIAVAAVCICYGHAIGLAVTALSIPVVAALLVHNDLPVVGTATIARIFAFSAASVGVWYVIRLFRTINFYKEVYQTVKPSEEDIPGLGWSAYPDGRMRFVNPAAAEFVGVTAEEMQEIMDADDDSWWRRFVHPDDVDRCLAKWNQSLKTGEPLYDEQRVRRYDGTYRWFRDAAVPARDAQGNITAWYGSTIDIDDQRKAEASVLASERKLRQLIDTVPALIWCADPEGRTSYVSKQLMTWAGLPSYSLSDIDDAELSTFLFDLIHPDDRSEAEAAYAAGFAGGKAFFLKYRQRRADGHFRWTAVRVAPLYDEGGEILQWYGVSLDINDEILAHEAVKNSEHELRVLIDTVPSLIWLITPDGKPYYLNKRFADWTGTASVGEVGRGDMNTTLENVHPDDRARVREAFLNAFASGQSLHIKARLRRKDGEFRWIDSRVEPLIGEGGHIVRWYGVSFEIEDEVRAQLALRESERYLQHLIDTVPVGIKLSNPEGEPIYVNKRVSNFDLRRSSPASEAARAAHPSLDSIHPEDREDVLARLAQHHSVGEPFVMRYRQKSAEGEFRWVEDRSEPFRDDSGSIVQWYGVTLDVDDEVRAQEALRVADERLARTSRAASLSELSVSIAHELNQPLQAVVANANAFQRWLAATPPNYEKATKTAEWIVRDADAAAEVVSRIRALFKKSGHQRGSVDVNATIEEVCRHVSDKLAGTGVKLDVQTETATLYAVADRIQIEQVILNLIRNGIEAMADKGVKSRRLRVMLRANSEGMLEVEVKDNGSGIEDPAKVFDAFYTTKTDGMGIGLAICRSIIESHGGQLWAKNNEGGGASVCFTLPSYPAVEDKDEAVVTVVGEPAVALAILQ